MEPAASEYYIWSLDGKPVSVHLNLKVVHELQPLVQPASGSRALEHGGILLGRVRRVNDCYMVCVDAAEMLTCEHARGASWTLSARDQQAMLRRIRRQHGSISVVGWFRTHTRPGLYLDQHDFTLFNDHFAHPSSVSLVVRPQDREAAFFFWEEGDIKRSSPYQTFPFIPQALGTHQEIQRFEPAAVDLVAVPAASVVRRPGRTFSSLVGRRALYAAPIVAGVLAGLLWQPNIERRRSAGKPGESELSRSERRVFTPPEPLNEQPVEAAEPVRATPVETAPQPVATRKVRPKPARKVAVMPTRPRPIPAAVPVITVQPPPITAVARLDSPAVLQDRVSLPRMPQTVREEKPSKMRRVIGSIPLLGFLKKKKPAKSEEAAGGSGKLDGSVASALTSSEAALSPSARPLRPADPASRPRTGAQVAR